MENRTHTQRIEAELCRAGLFDDDSDYGGAIGEAVMALVRVHAEQGHSGASSLFASELFARLNRGELLTPITSDPAEWEGVGEPDKPLWQNLRKPSVFSNDGGLTHWDVDAADRTPVPSTDPAEARPI